MFQTYEKEIMSLLDMMTAGVTKKREPSEEETENWSEFRKFVCSLKYYGIAYDVSGGWEEPEKIREIVAVCRRKFKAKDVILWVNLDLNEEYEAGMVFAEDRIIIWGRGGATYEEIKYADVTEVDYDEYRILITHNGGEKSVKLTEDDEDMYPKEMYMFLMDIMDYLDEN